NLMKNYVCILAVFLLFTQTPGALTFAQGDTLNHPPCVEQDIPHYIAYRTASKPQIDGCLDEFVWQNAPRSPRFRDLIFGKETIHDTRAAVLWDDEYLYVAYWIEEPDLQATLLERDAPIYQNNDVELFIAGSDGYYEFEINSFGTIYEVLFFWDEAYKAGSYDTIAGIGVGEPGSKPFHGVGYKNHPRGPRTGFFKWDFPGLQTAVYLDGTINDSSDRDRGWTVELALPWEGMALLSMGDQRTVPPQDHDVWRMDFSRFNQYKQAPPSEDPGGWAWSPHGVWDSHVPECFTYIHFSLDDVVVVDL
ncbi:MAG: carbohydrate-binding family 9-like protein, partial [Bacteroidota bacterium]|nr:carbohydrate-binding family 9-like protein [Bacteroidota bacterium]